MFSPDGLARWVSHINENPSSARFVPAKPRFRKDATRTYLSELSCSHASVHQESYVSTVYSRPQDGWDFSGEVAGGQWMVPKRLRLIKRNRSYVLKLLSTLSPSTLGGSDAGENLCIRENSNKILTRQESFRPIAQRISLAASELASTTAKIENHSLCSMVE